MTLRGEERRLRALFRRVMLVSIAASGAVAACRAADVNRDSPDATPEVDATVGDSGQTDVTVADNEVPIFDADLPDFNFTWCPSGPPYPFDARALFDADGGICDIYSKVPCGLPPGVKTGVYGDLTRVDCTTVCATDASVLSCYVLDGADFHNLPDAPAIIMECATCLGGGRRPDGLRAPVLPCTSARGVVGDYLARMAYLEGASVYAFVQMRRELSAFGAPRRLVRGAARAARDEVRHARTTARLARRYGAVTERPSTRDPQARTMDAMAIENVIEGCVRETFGAMIATWQRDHAKDPEVAAAMRDIAADETRHAALAWAVAAWLEPHLDAEGLARLARARGTAVAALRREIGAPVARALTDALGLPTAPQARALVDEMARALWA